ncbi:MAG: glutamate 5-kinase [Phycisphaeraceae bacterium]|nr:glutamate 5-kinase [Phycisphaeraceae bacterium]
MPSTHLRQNQLLKARHIVVKLGTQLLTDDTGKLDQTYIQHMADQVAQLHSQGFWVTLVSSGAIGAGLAELKLSKRPKDVAQLQAVAAVGQRKLMTCFHDAFEKHSLEVGQLLLTRSDLDDRVRYLNFRNCIAATHRFGCIPIINENDSVAVDEIRFGDNDMLGALACNALRADVLVILSVVEGLLDDQGQRIDLVENAKSGMKYAREDKTALGTGGISTKLEAAQLVTDAGEVAVIANGRIANVLVELFAGRQGVGTVFVPAKKKLNSRSRFIGQTSRPSGKITIDDGAAKALTHKGKSLLATGITQVKGHFEHGQVIEVLSTDGVSLARGLSNYSDAELKLIQGKRSNQFLKILGREAYAEVIHRDNMVVFK